MSGVVRRETLTPVTIQKALILMSDTMHRPIATRLRVKVVDGCRITFYVRKSPPVRAWSETPTVSLALGDNREGKERVKGEASRVQSTTIGSALVCVRRNVQHRELKLPKSARFSIITAVMVAIPTGGPTGCVVNPPPLLSQNIQSHEKSPTSHRAQRVPPTVSLAPGANREGKERVNGKASRI